MNRLNSLTQYIRILLIFSLALSAPTFAADAGFQKANDAINWWATGLASLSVVTITLCICWIGYKVLWDGKRIAEMTNVIIGGILIAGAAGFAAWYAV